MATLKHLHTYVRSKWNKTIYRCAHPDCTHYINRDKLRGKRAKCKCGKEFVIEEVINAQLRRREIKCMQCISGKVNKSMNAAANIMDTVLGMEAMNEVAQAPDVEMEVVLKQPSKGIEQPDLFKPDFEPGDLWEEKEL